MAAKGEKKLLVLGGLEENEKFNGEIGSHDLFTPTLGTTVKLGPTDMAFVGKVSWPVKVEGWSYIPDVSEMESSRGSLNQTLHDIKIVFSFLRFSIKV